MKRKILLPTDFSANASKAIKYALEIYKNEPCIFYLLNVFYVKSNDIEGLLTMDKGSPRYESAKNNSENGLNKLAKDFAFSEKGHQKHSFQTISLFNDVLEAIKTTVEEKDIELIVMGTRGETNSESSIYGSVAISVMEKIRNCPVIVVPQVAKPQLPKEIVFPTSYKNHYKKRELNYLIDIAKKCDASIKVLHISNEDTLSDAQLNNKNLLEDCFEDVNHSFHYLSRMSVSDAIICFVESRESDMVAFINKKHSFFGSILSQPLVKGIAYDIRVPLLVMHDLQN